MRHIHLAAKETMIVLDMVQGVIAIENVRAIITSVLVMLMISV